MELPEILRPEQVVEILGLKTIQALYRLEIPRCRFLKRKVVFLKADLLKFLESKKEAGGDFDLDDYDFPGEEI